MTANAGAGHAGRILAALQARAAAGAPQDGMRLALVIEGGGMRGVVCGGMVAALEHIGLTQGFDEVIGSSAGAIAGAYFVAGQAAFGTRIFYEEINNRRFIAKRRLFLGKPVVSVDFLLDEVCRGPKELDWQAVLTARSRLVCVASSLDRRQSAAIAHFADKEALFHALKASARIPGVAGPPVVIDGERFVDAGVYENIPYATARARGATHILALRTRPQGHAAHKLDLVEKLLVAPWLDRQQPGVGEQYRAHLARYRGEIAAIDAAASGLGPPYVAAVTLPPEAVAISNIERRRTVLQQGALMGFQAVYRAFGLEAPAAPAGLNLTEYP